MLTMALLKLPVVVYMSAAVLPRPGAQKQCSRSIMKKREWHCPMTQKRYTGHSCFRESNIKPAPSSYQPSHLTLVACILQNARSSPVMRNAKYSGLLGMFASLVSRKSLHAVHMCQRKDAVINRITRTWSVYTKWMCATNHVLDNGSFLVIEKVSSTP